MPAPLPSYPFINGNRYDHSSIIINLAGVPYDGIVEVTYKQSLKPGKVRGTRAQNIGRTRGIYEPEASFTILKTEFDQLKQALVASAGPGIGYMEVSFDISVTYDEPALGTTTDIIRGCRISTADTSSSEGGDAIKVKCDLDVMLIVEGGVTPLGGRQFARG